MIDQKAHEDQVKAKALDTLNSARVIRDVTTYGLAKRMGVDRASLVGVFKGRSPLGLRRMAHVLYHLGFDLEFKLVPLKKEGGKRDEKVRRGDDVSGGLHLGAEAR